MIFLWKLLKELRQMNNQQTRGCFLWVNAISKEKTENAKKKAVPIYMTRLVSRNVTKKYKLTNE